MRKLKLYSKTRSILFPSENIITLENMTMSRYKLAINKAACISLFLSLIGNSLSSTFFMHSSEMDNSLGNLQEELNDRRAVSIINDKNVLEEYMKKWNIETSFRDSGRGFYSVGFQKLGGSTLTEEDVDRIYEFMIQENLSLTSFSQLLDMMTSPTGPFGKISFNKKSALTDLMRENKSYFVKFLIIMARDGYTYEQLDYMFAGIVGEATGSGQCYDDAYAVASTLINRSHTLWYVNRYGHNFYDIFMAPGQYEIEVSGNYLKYLGAIDLEGYHAAIDAFYTRESMHDYLQFRADWVDLNCHYETFAPGGNKFLDKMKEYEYVPYPDEVVEIEDVKTYVLNGVKY